MQSDNSKLIYYVSFIGKEPRKRKERRFETTVGETADVETAKQRAKELISTYKLRDVRNVRVQGWNVDEGPEITFRALFPSTEAISIEL